MNQGTFLFYAFFVLMFIGAALCAIKISITDWRRRIIPDAFLFPLMLIGLLAAAYWPGWPTSPQMAAVGGTIGYAASAIAGWVTDRRLQRKKPGAPAAIGMGDIKLLAVGGMWLGPTGVANAVIISGLFGAVWSRHTHQKYIPFAPFFVAGGILSFIGLLFLL